MGEEECHAVVNLLYNKSTTNRSNGIWTKVSVTIVTPLPATMSPNYSDYSRQCRQGFID